MHFVTVILEKDRGGRHLGKPVDICVLAPGHQGFKERGPEFEFDHHEAIEPVFHRFVGAHDDPRVLLHIPRGFDASRPAVMVLFFHGHGATLERDVHLRQQLPRQISESGMNAVLVAPQLAVDARDSSPGKLWEPEGVKRFMAEAANKLAKCQVAVAKANPKYTPAKTNIPARYTRLGPN